MESQMTDPFDALPWWLAAFAAVIVGSITMVTAGDIWASIIRSGLAFVIFCAIGFVARHFLRTTANRKADRTSPPGSGFDAKPEQLPISEDFAEFTRNDQE